MKESTRSAWAGYAFEQVCLHHISQIREKLSIKGVLTNMCSWSVARQADKDGTEWPGAQIDLLLCRADHVIDVCEMKYSETKYTLTGSYAGHLREREATFRHSTKTTDALHHILITTFKDIKGSLRSKSKENQKENLTKEGIREDFNMILERSDQRFWTRFLPDFERSDHKNNEIWQ